MPYRNPARYLAPLALAAAFIAVLMVLGGGDGSGSSSSVQTRPTTTATTTPRTGTKAPRRQPSTYTVRPGDVLSAIAERTGVPLDRIIDLNDDLDPQALRAGQKIRLRR